MKIFRIISGLPSLIKKHSVHNYRIFRKSIKSKYYSSSSKKNYHTFSAIVPKIDEKLVSEFKDNSFLDTSKIINKKEIRDFCNYIEEDILTRNFTIKDDFINNKDYFLPSESEVRK